MKGLLTQAAALISVLALGTAVVTADVSPQQRYIDTYKGIAIDEMYRSGVPASITLAQGLLESRYGLSDLAAKGNNHFGIKCHNDWKGKTMKVDDDRKGECFRVYPNAGQSFRDHSDFLRFRDRYKALFELDITDYSGWAYGLSKAGYATDPAYPQKLIRLIEDYGLARYDSGWLDDTEVEERLPGSGGVSKDDGRKDDRGRSGAAADNSGGKKGSASQTRHQKHSGARAQGNNTSAARAGRGEGASKKASSSRRRGQEGMPKVQRSFPEPPSALEQPEKLDAGRAHEVFHFTMERSLYTQNGVPFVYSEPGESYATIAEDYNLFPREILKFNDLSSDRPLAPGTVVYVRAKKKQAATGIDKYIVESDGEQLRDICQRFAVRMKSVLKLNAYADGHVLREGDTVILR